MASTAAGRQLTERHRLSQVRVAAAVVAQIRQLFGLLGPDTLADNSPAFVDAAVTLIAHQHGVSVALARGYYRTFRAVEAGAGATAILPTPGLDLDRVRTSLAVTGPIKIKQGMAAGRTFERASLSALTAAAGAASRHVLGGGRDMLTGAIRSDRRALGYARATSGRPCAFCALLAGRGPTFSDEASAGFQAHDACACVPEPVYRADAPFPGERFAALYQEQTAGSSDPLNAFRRAYEAAG
ncbi:MAG TPA: hypothetical protein VGA36_09630 [Nitriliruptorales bacterium]